MPDIAVKGVSMCTAHDEYGPTVGMTGQEVMKVNGHEVMCVTDKFEPHTHTPTLVEGSSVLFINGLPVSFVGCACDCGSVVANGDNTVTISK